MTHRSTRIIFYRHLTVLNELREYLRSLRDKYFQNRGINDPQHTHHRPLFLTLHHRQYQLPLNPCPYPKGHVPSLVLLDKVVLVELCVAIVMLESSLVKPPVYVQGEETFGRKTI